MNDDEERATSGVTLRLYVRSLAPHQARDCQRRLVERLVRLGTDDPRLTTDVVLWGPEIDLSGPELRTATGERVRETLDRIRSWAERNGVRLDPFFRERRVSPMVGESYTEVRFPQHCLVVSAGDDILDVVPCTVDGESYSVAEYLDRFEPERGGETGANSAATPELQATRR